MTTFNLRKLLTASHFLMPSQINAHLNIRPLNGALMGKNKEILSLCPGNFDYLIIFVG